MSPTEMNESYFIEMLSWLDQLAGNETSPDAFDNILLVAIGIVELIFDRAVEPSPTEISDLATSGWILSSRRRNLAAYAIVFLKLAVSSPDEDMSSYLAAKKLPKLGKSDLLAALTEARDSSYPKRYKPPISGSFSDFEAYHANLRFADIMADIQEWPDITAFNRTLACMERLINLACDDPAVSPQERLKAGQMADVIEKAARTMFSSGLADSDAYERFQRALRATHDYIRNYAYFSDMAEKIITGDFAR
ncbi:MAG: hypothetical protein WBF10_08455 [Methylovirgula sp.]